MRARVFSAPGAPCKRNVFLRPENGHLKARVSSASVSSCRVYNSIAYVFAVPPLEQATFVYGDVMTFQIVLQDAGVFEMLTLAQELGVEDLQNSCEEHVTSTMSVLNACTFLAAAMDIQDRASSTYTTEL